MIFKRFIANNILRLLKQSVINSKKTDPLMYVQYNKYKNNKKNHVQ